MRIPFTKMQGLGNDFVIINAIEQPISFTAAQIRWLADRHFGIGCDHLLLLETPQQAKVDFVYRIFNADGLEAEVSGNGTRCVAKYVYAHGLTHKHDITVGTRSRLMHLHLEDDGQVTVEIGKPETNPQKIPFLTAAAALRYPLDLGNAVVEIGAVSVGNPHAVVLVDAIATAPVATMGAAIGKHPQFPEGVNVNFMEVVDRNTVKLRVFERGVGETLACGSGACASVVVGRLWNLLNEKVTVKFTSGDLVISWQDVNGPVFMTGPAVEVFTGEFEF